MRIIRINSQPYAVINGKDFAVYRWFAPGQHGPLFVQLAGRTVLSREDMPSEDWVVLPGKDRGHRLATAWRKPWFDYRMDATRKLAFLGGSTEGSYFLALRYLARRFGFTFTDTDLAAKSGELAGRQERPYPHVLDDVADVALTRVKLVTLDVPSYWDADDAARLFAA